MDIVPNEDGYNHIALFSPAESETPKWLTSGSWEVTSEILGIDIHKRLVYSPAFTKRIMCLNDFADTSLQLRLLL